VNNNDNDNIGDVDDLSINRMQSIYAYACEVLDALDVKWGPAHIEIMWREKEEVPVLIEANVGRWHGQDTVTLCNMAYNCNAVALTLDAYLSNGIEKESPLKSVDETPSTNIVPSTSTKTSSLEAYQQHRLSAYHRWTAVPPTPYKRTRCAGRIVHLMSHVEGILSEPPHHIDQILGIHDVIDLDNIDVKNNPINDHSQNDNDNDFDRKESNKHVFKSLFRFASKYDAEDIGQWIPKTIDLHTTAGYALLLHPEKNVVDTDYFKLVELQLDMFSVI
jgi:hypothetical protein